MNKAEYLSRVISRPMAMSQIHGRTYLRALAMALLRSERPSEDVFGEILPKMQIIGDVALIPVSGVVDMGVPDWLKLYGFNLTDVNDVEEEIATALADANVKLLVFPTDSPGGLGLAAEKLFDVIEAANRKKPCFAYCADGAMMCSGSYWPAAACTAIYSGWYAEAIGNIGAYSSILDDTEFWAQMGIKFEIFRSGEYKGIGEDSLSEPQRTYLQTLTDACGNLFRKNVARYRTEIAPADMQGQWFKGSEAAQRGFVAGNAKDLNAAIAKFRRMG